MNSLALKPYRGCTGKKKKCVSSIVYFQKTSVPSPKKGFSLRSPSLKITVTLNTFVCIVVPPLPRNSNYSFFWQVRGYGYFLKI